MTSTRRALLSVHDKTGIVELARALVELGFEVLSTGGTARTLREAGVPVRDVSEVTGSPEILGGRVKTLHPALHGGILGRRDLDEDRAEMARHAISPIDLVAVNLYPFTETVARPGCTLAEAIEQIDIGGPTLLRAAAKNWKHVIVLCDPGDYRRAVEGLRAGGLADGHRLELAGKVFRLTARYDGAIAGHLSRAHDPAAPFPESLSVAAERAFSLRYGENPHQKAAFYRVAGDAPSLADARVLQGKELSYNNLLDLDAALGLVLDLPHPAAVVVKHTNPCGVALGATLEEAYRHARGCDPVSAFGGIVGLSAEVDGDTARALAETFLEAVVAPSFSEAAEEVLGAKKNLRLVAVGAERSNGGLSMRRVRGGLLVQEEDRLLADPGTWRVVTRRTPSTAERSALDLAWRVVKHVKSNAIVFAQADRILGVGAGQMSRVDAVRIAVLKATAVDAGALRGSAVASDAFFPFPDGLIAASEAGATAVVQPGGSVRDAEVIAAADERDVAMMFTGIRHFRH